MADCYTQFCENLGVMSSVDMDWITKMEEIVHLDVNGDPVAANSPDLDYVGPSIFWDAPEVIRDDCSSLGFSYSQNDKDELIIAAVEGDDDPERCCFFWQKFLEAMRPPHAAIVLTWLHLTTKGGPNAFGGGVAVITARYIRKHDMSMWASRTIKNLALNCLNED